MITFNGKRAAEGDFVRILVTKNSTSENHYAKVYLGKAYSDYFTSSKTAKQWYRATSGVISVVDESEVPQASKELIEMNIASPTSTVRKFRKALELSQQLKEDKEST